MNNNRIIKFPPSFMFVVILILLVIAEYLLDPFGIGSNNLGVTISLLVALGIAAYALIFREKAECYSKLAEQATQRFESLSKNIDIALLEQNLTTLKSWENELFTSLFPALKGQDTDKLHSLIHLIEPKRSKEIMKAIDALSVDAPAITENFTLSSSNEDKTLWLEGRFRKHLKQGETHLSVALIDKSNEIQSKLKLQSSEASLKDSKHRLADLDQLLSVTAVKTSSDIINIDLPTQTLRFIYGAKNLGFGHEECGVNMLMDAIMPSYRHYFAALLKGSTTTFEAPLLGVNKSTYWWSFTPIKNRSDSQSDSINIYIREVSEQKLATDRIIQARHEAELAMRKLNVTADMAHIGLFDIDPVTEKIRPSPTMRELLDLPNVESLPLHFLPDAFEGVSNERLIKVLEKLSFFTGPERFELTLVSDDVKRHFVMHLSSQGLISSERKILGSLVETTEYISLQEQLRDALNKSQQSLAELELRYEKEMQMFGFISHEIRTPISAIRMMLEDEGDHKRELLETTANLEKLIDHLKEIVDRSDMDIKIGSEQTKATNTGTFTLAGKQVLLAEDTPTIRMLTTKLIESQDAIVTAAEDGQKALDIAKNRDFDLVITDIFMPNMDGYQLSQALREAGYTGPIIGVTAATIGAERDNLIAAGASAAIGKPLTKEKLLDTLASL
ncbi:response regulator [Marinobacterium sp. LSUCC0821]|uniref:response regulator n=1 Tax=Marinobacterium sp. LSUCC0821 TaxID=2668067 RepID=UPI00145279E3|nr:response regulator [Marinobacterium sp. LSUCC0821]QJD70891.1 response regulator [Marinobacterium sp. LSUCC0821]